MTEEEARRTPVIVGVGEINDRPADGAAGLDSAELMATALRRADADAGGGWLESADWLAIVPQISFPDLDLPSLLPAQLGIAPAKVIHPRLPHGDTPVRHLNDAANAVASGEAQVCLIAGAEALRTAARRQAEAGKSKPLFAASSRAASDIRQRYGLVVPADIYPLYENAARAAWGQTLAEGQAESGQIWAKFSEVAAEAEGAWLKQPRTAEEIVTPSLDNRPIAFPYTKLQVANSAVNQGAALIVTSLARAISAGADPARLVFVGAGAAAHEAYEPLTRASFTRTPAMEVTLEQAMAKNGLSASDLDHVELYSCFPCVPKMARRILGLPADRPLSVHGGLTFGGGPIGNYMTHAAAAMVRKLRAGGRHGLLYGNGGHCTDNHALVLSREPRGGLFPQNYDCQAEADARRGPIPVLTDRYEGPARIETYTVFYHRAGEPSHAAILARNAAGERVASRIDGSDAAAITFLTDGQAEPIGTTGETERVGDHLFWRSNLIATSHQNVNT